jgi:hypothetical protein
MSSPAASKCAALQADAAHIDRLELFVQEIASHYPAESEWPAEEWLGTWDDLIGGYDDWYDTPFRRKIIDIDGIGVIISDGCHGRVQPLDLVYNWLIRPTLRRWGHVNTRELNEAHATVTRALRLHCARSRRRLARLLMRTDSRFTLAQCIDEMTVGEVRAAYENHPSRVDMVASIAE